LGELAEKLGEKRRKNSAERRKLGVLQRLQSAISLCAEPTTRSIANREAASL
jgi:hypothetical protein